MNKKALLFTVLLAFAFAWVGPDLSLAAVLDDSLKPSNLPSYNFDAIEATSAEHSETRATQALILFVGNLVSQVLLFAGAVTIIFVMLTGGTYLFSFGDDTKIEKGKRGLFWSLLGLVVIMLSYTIVRGVISIILQVDSNAT